MRLVGRNARSRARVCCPSCRKLRPKPVVRPRRAVIWSVTTPFSSTGRMAIVPGFMTSNCFAVCTVQYIRDRSNPFRTHHASGGPAVVWPLTGVRGSDVDQQKSQPVSHSRMALEPSREGKTNWPYPDDRSQRLVRHSEPISCDRPKLWAHGNKSTRLCKPIRSVRRVHGGSPCKPC